jgi:hypothetical protein
MPLQRLTYHFVQPLPASRPRAYRWATDFRPSDFELSGINGRRRIERLAVDLVLLTDSFEEDPFDSRAGARTVKTKLVHLYPERWSWTSTHIAGPARHSQFLYELTPRGSAGSTLHFTGSQVETMARRPNPESVQRRTRELLREDAHLWVELAAALGKDPE